MERKKNAEPMPCADCGHTLDWHYWDWDGSCMVSTSEQGISDCPCREFNPAKCICDNPPNYCERSCPVHGDGVWRNHRDRKENMKMIEQESVKRLAYSIADVAEMLGLSVGFIRKEIRTGHISAIRIGNRVLIRTESLDAYVQAAAPVVPDIVAVPLEATLAPTPRKAVDDFEARWLEWLSAFIGESVPITPAEVARIISEHCDVRAYNCLRECGITLRAGIELYGSGENVLLSRLLETPHCGQKTAKSLVGLFEDVSRLDCSRNTSDTPYIGY